MSDSPAAASSEIADRRLLDWRGDPRIEMNFYTLLEERAPTQGDHPALVTPSGTTWSYAELHERAALLGAVLSSSGTGSGDRVVVQVPKSLDNVALYLAVLRIGAVYVPLNEGYTGAEVDFFLRDAAPSAFVAGAARRVELESTLGEIGARGFELGTGSELDLAELAAASSHRGTELSAAPVVERAGDDLAAIVYTSGTTGRSKGAMVTHANLSTNALSLHEIWGFEPGDVLLHALPIFHVHGLFVALHTAFLNGSKILFLDRFDAAEVRDRLGDSTVLMGVPTFYSRLLAEPGFGRGDCHSMRLFISGSAPLTEGTFAEFEERTGHRILERYGMSEAGMITSNPLAGERVAGTVGFPLPGVEVRVANEEGRVLDAGEVGVLEIRGPNLFRGYWQLPEKTAQEHREDGFFITGDVARLDVDGRVSIVGREKDLIISGGYNIYPKEIELLLDAMDEVVESAVVGAPHADLGEGVVAVLVPQPGAAPPSDDEMRRRLEASLARFKHPRRFVWADELPRNAMGKVQKNALREEHRDAYR